MSQEIQDLAKIIGTAFTCTIDPDHANGRLEMPTHGGNTLVVVYGGKYGAFKGKFHAFAKRTADVPRDVLDTVARGEDLDALRNLTCTPKTAPKKVLEIVGKWMADVDTEAVAIGHELTRKAGILDEARVLAEKFVAKGGKLYENAYAFEVSGETMTVKIDKGIGQVVEVRMNTRSADKLLEIF